MRRILPIDRESPFAIDELFFSRTDTRGVITACNDVFARVSGYTAAEMLGKPHNLIRHPDMPKAVFRYFWETLQSNRSIVAYVKNMAVDGSYYWVLAAAFPTSDGYVSIRMKPTSVFFTSVKRLYADVLTLEQSEGIEKSHVALLQKIRDLGFETYEDFARHALVTEMAARDGAMERETIASGSSLTQTENTHPGLSPAGKATTAWLRRIETASRDAARKYQAIFDVTSLVAQTNERMQEGAREILSSYRSIKFLSFNMIVTAERAGEKGRVLSVVSETFQRWAAVVCEAMESVEQRVTDMTRDLNVTNLGVVTIRFQFDMLMFYARELLTYLEDGKSDTPDALASMEENMLPFLTTALEVFGKAEGAIGSVRAAARILEAELEELHEGVRGLLIIRQTGRVEATYLDELSQLFDGHIESMGAFITQVGAATDSLHHGTAGLTKELAEISATIFSVTKIFASLHAEKSPRLKNADAA